MTQTVQMMETETMEMILGNPTGDALEQYGG